MEFYAQKEKIEQQDSIRKELEDYLSEVRSKVTEDGEPLVHYPKNFDRVANAMNRSDLVGDGETETTPWSKYLLAEAAMDGRAFEKGRYKELLKDVKEETKVERGLAEICMLDKQLKEALRKSKAINAQNTPRGVISGADDDSNSAASTPRTARSTDSGVSRVDNTFLTLRGRRSNATTPAQSPPSTARSSTTNFSPEQSRSSGSNVPSQKAKRNFLEENKAKVAQHNGPSLTLEEELRVRALTLDDEEGDRLFELLATHGFKECESERLTAIDKKLDDIAAEDCTGLSRAMREYMYATESTSSEESGEDAPTRRGNSKQNVLLEQRVDRARKAYIDQLDETIESLKKKPLGLEGLCGEREIIYRSVQSFDHDDDDGAGSPCSDPMMMSSSNPKGPISLGKLHAFMRTTIASFIGKDGSADDGGNDSAKVPRRKLDSLLRSLRDERDALGEIRMKNDTYDKGDNGEDQRRINRRGIDGLRSEAIHNNQQGVENADRQSAVSSVPSLPCIYKLADDTQLRASSTKSAAKRAELLNMVESLHI